jgi:hypothetical protein
VSQWKIKLRAHLPKPWVKKSQSAEFALERAKPKRRKSKSAMDQASKIERSFARESSQGPHLCDVRNAHRCTGDSVRRKIQNQIFTPYKHLAIVLSAMFAVW